MVVRKSRAPLANLDREAALRVLRVGRVEVLLEIRDHAVARVAIRAEECVVVPDAVYALPDLLLREAGTRVLGGQRLDRPLLALDVPLNFASRAVFRVYLLGGDRDEVVSKQIERLVLLKDGVHGVDRLDAGEAE